MALSEPNKNTDNRRIHSKKGKPSVVLDPTRLCKRCMIGCTVLPSHDDPTLANGVALTTLNAFDETYVQFEDIDGMGEPSYRFWKDVFLIVAWNDPQYPPLKVGDKAFALYQNKDRTFTTVYYHAQIRGKPSKRNDHQMVIDFLDGTGQYTNIKMVPTTSINTTDGKLTVPTVIRTLCASDTAIHHNALQHYQRSKRNRAKTKKKMDKEQKIKSKQHTESQQNSNTLCVVPASVPSTQSSQAATHTNNSSPLSRKRKFDNIHTDVQPTKKRNIATSGHDHPSVQTTTTRIQSLKILDAEKANESHQEDEPQQTIEIIDKTKWSADDCAKWVGSLGNAYKQYMESFVHNGIDGDLLNELDHDTLKEVIPLKLHRTKILMAWHKVQK
eukprot:42955_1